MERSNAVGLAHIEAQYLINTNLSSHRTYFCQALVWLGVLPSCCEVGDLGKSTVGWLLMS